MEKLKKTARGLDVFFKISLWLMVILAAIMIVSTTVLCIKGAGDMSNTLTAMQLSINGIGFDPINAIPESVYKDVWITTLIHFLVLFAFICYGICIIRKMLSPMKEGKPFNTNISKDFKKLGWFTVAFGIASNVIDYSITTFLTNRLYASIPFSISIDSSLSLNFIVIAFAFFLLSYVFSYGEELQRLSDETL